MFDIDVAALAQAGAVGIALGMVMVGGFVAYKVAIRLIGAAERILTNHLSDLTEEIRGMRGDINEGLRAVEVALVGGKPRRRTKAGAQSSSSKSVSGRPDDR